MQYIAKYCRPMVPIKFREERGISRVTYEQHRQSILWLVDFGEKHQQQFTQLISLRGCIIRLPSTILLNTVDTHNWYICLLLASSCATSVENNFVGDNVITAEILLTSIVYLTALSILGAVCKRKWAILNVQKWTFKFSADGGSLQKDHHKMGRDNLLTWHTQGNRIVQSCTTPILHSQVRLKAKIRATVPKNHRIIPRCSSPAYARQLATLPAKHMDCNLYRQLTGSRRPPFAKFSYTCHPELLTCQ